MHHSTIDNGAAFDWGRASADYARFRDIYPAAFYQKIVDLGLCTAGQNVLDLATGTGVLPRNLYQFGAKFTGVDIAANQITQARRLADVQGMRIDFQVCAVEDVEFPDESFDVVTACQCFLYFDKAVVLPRVHRLLRRDGHFCILFMAWLPFESEIAKVSEDLVLRYNPSWTGGRMRRTKPEAPQGADRWFTVDHAVGYDLSVPFTRESWHGRIKACRGIGASSLSAAQIAAWENEHLAYLESVPEQFEIPHYVTLVDLRKRTE